MLTKLIQIERRWMKTVFITIAIQNKGKQKGYMPARTQIKSAGNAIDYVATGFSFASDWLRCQHEFSRSIQERGEAKALQSQITSDTQLELNHLQNNAIALNYSYRQ